MKTKKYIHTTALILACSFVLFSCANEEPTQEEKKCTPACGEGEVCKDGECKQKNLCENVTCNEGEYCSNGECVKKTGLSCNSNEDCTKGESCQNGVCAATIVDNCTNVKCDSGYYCVNGNCVAEDFKSMDSDNDTISDHWEGRSLESVDTDADGEPDYMDKDSDNDTVPDADEFGFGLEFGDEPADSDEDGTYDYRDDDSDGNGILDKDECFTGDGKLADTDDDGNLDCHSSDNDGDGALDLEEIQGFPNRLDPTISVGDCDNDTVPDPFGSADSPWDCDSDTIPDYIDVDSDGDTILDRIETRNIDSDADGFTNRYSQDSDGDTIPDSKEHGAALGELPIDTDKDTIPDYRDLDSDNDGISDANEPICPDPSLDARISYDVDSDGFGDSAEYAIALAQNIDPELLVCVNESTKTDGETPSISNFIEFYFELPYETSEEATAGEPKIDILKFIPKVSKLDLVFNVDTTSSMTDSVNNIKTSISNIIIPGVRKQVEDSSFGLSIFQDYPFNGHGVDGHVPWQSLGNIESDETIVASYVNNSKFNAHGGGDVSESGYEALYQIATNEGGQNITKVTQKPDHWGGMNFRQTTLPVVIHVTDADAHNRNQHAYGNKVTNPHYEAEALNVLKKNGVRVITVDASGSLQADGVDKQSNEQFQFSIGQLTRLSYNTNAVVPLCGLQYKNKAQCATATDGIGEVNTKTNDGHCVLRFQAKADGSGLSDTIVEGVKSLVKYSTFNVAARVRGVPIPDTDKDTSCFLQKVEAYKYNPPTSEEEKTCTPVAEPADFNAKGYNDGFKNFATGKLDAKTEGATLEYKISARNVECFKPKDYAQVFEAYIDIYEATTGLVFDTQRVSVIVPGIVNNIELN